jgi:hypothetical protein
MANKAVVELQKQAKEARMKTYLKLKDGETQSLIKRSESELGYGKYGAQALYQVETSDGKVVTLALGIGHPGIDFVEELAMNAKFSMKRTGSGKEDTRYEFKKL